MIWTDVKFCWKKEKLLVKPVMIVRQSGYDTKATEEQQTANDVQYNQSGAQFASGYMPAQGSITNLTVTDAVQQKQITILQVQLTQSNDTGKVYPTYATRRKRKPWRQTRQGQKQMARSVGVDATPCRPACS